MAPVEVTDDYYAILEVSQTASIADIKKSYHRLIKLPHPDKNHNSPEATASFQLLNRAWETLKEENSRRLYDIKWPHITKTFRAAQERAKRDAETTKVENEKSAKEKAARDAEERKSKSIIEGYVKKKQNFESEIFEVKRVITRVQSELKKIQELEDKALEEERRRKSWFTYMYSSVFSAAKEPEGAKQERDLQRLQRQASRTIKEKELSRKEGNLKEWNDLLSGVEKAIAAEIASSRERARRAEREREEARRREEARYRQRQQEELRETMRKQQEENAKREQAKRAAAEAQAAQAHAAWQAAEQRRKKEAAEWLRKEAKEAEESRKREEEWQKNFAETMRKARAASHSSRASQEAAASSQSTTKPIRSSQAKTATATASSAPCQHRGWWGRVEHGSLICQNCYSAQKHFLFECPDCRMRACAGCRSSLKGGGGARRAQPRVNQRSWGGFGSAYDERYEDCYEDRYEASTAYDWYD